MTGHLLPLFPHAIITFTQINSRATKMYHYVCASHGPPSGTWVRVAYTQIQVTI
jgi:hypothetical protein